MSQFFIAHKMLELYIIYDHVMLQIAYLLCYLHFNPDLDLRNVQSSSSSAFRKAVGH